MTPFLAYMIKAGAALILFYGFYELLLKRETYFHLNRLYLVAALFLSFLLPAIPLASPFRTLPLPADFGPVSSAPLPVRSVDSTDLLPVIYAAGALLLFVRFGAHLLRLGRVIRRNGVRRDGPIRIVTVERDFSPFSFFGLVFINLRDPRLSESDLRRILAHERVHVRQGHSFDVLLMELVIILQWFNPFVWPYKKALRETHEYLADSGVIAQGFSSVKYRRLVFEQHAGAPLFEFGNNFKQSQIKRRIAMMSKSQSGKASRLKLLLALPLVLILVLAFAEPRAAVSALSLKQAAQAGSAEGVGKAQTEQTLAEIKKLEQILKVLIQKSETAADEKSKMEWLTARGDTIRKLEMLKASLALSPSDSAAAGELRKIQEREAVYQAELEKVRDKAARADLEKKLQTIREEREQLTVAREKSDIREESGAALATIKAKELREKEAVRREGFEKIRSDEEQVVYKKRRAEIQELRQASRADRAAQADKAAAVDEKLRAEERDLRILMEKTGDKAAKEAFQRSLDKISELRARKTSALESVDETAIGRRKLRATEAAFQDQIEKVRESDEDVAVGITTTGLKKIIAELTDAELAVRLEIEQTTDEKVRVELKTQLADILKKSEAAKAEFLRLKSAKK